MSLQMKMLAKKRATIFLLCILGGMSPHVTLINTWQPLKIGGGGNVDKLDIAQSDNSMVAGSDQYGCYVLNGSTWVNMTTADRMPASVDSHGAPYNPTCEEVVLDPSHTNNIWMLTNAGYGYSNNGQLSKTNNKGAAVTTLSGTGFPNYHITFGGGANKSRRPFISVDPNNSRVVLVSTPSQGLYVTNDATNFNPVHGVGAGLPNSYPISSAGTDSTSVTTCTGVVTLRNNSGNFKFTGGNVNYVSIWQTSNPANIMYGTVDSVIGNPQSGFRLKVLYNDGTCSHSDWTVSLQNRSGGGTITAFDPTSPVVGGKTQGIYACTYGVGVFHSGNGGAIWSPTASGGPIYCGQMKVAPDGTLWFMQTVSNGQSLWTYNNKTQQWTHFTSPTTAAYTFDIDSKNCSSPSVCHVVVISSNTIWYTENGGGTWNTISGYTRLVAAAASDQPSWIVPLINGGFGWYPGVSKFDDSGNVYIGAEGVYYFRPSKIAKALTVNLFSKGMEMAEIYGIAADPNNAGHVLVGSYDFGALYLTTPNEYPSAISGYNPYGPTLKNVYSMDYAAASDTTNVVTVGDGGRHYTYRYSGVSTSSGAPGSFVALQNDPTLTACKGSYCVSANVCMSTANDILVMPVDNQKGAVFPYYTVDGGKHWYQITVTGTRITGGWPVSGYNLTKMCAADPTTPGKYYLYNWDVNGNGYQDAIVTCTNGGASCVWTSHPSLMRSGSSSGGGRLKAAPNGDLWFSPGLQTYEPRATPFSYSTAAKGGVSFQTVTGMANVTAFGLGAIFPGKSYYSLYATGWYTGTVLINGEPQSVTKRRGIYMCKDFSTQTGDCNSTWQQIGTQYPNGWTTMVIDMDGDKHVPGLVYGATKYGGAFYGQFNYLLKRDFHHDNDNSPSFLVKAG